MYPIYTLWKAVEKEHEDKATAIVAGVDVAYRNDRYFAALTAFRNGKLLTIKTDEGFSPYPYVSSLFFLKEGPIISKIIYGEEMDLLFVNGHGICHPHHYGLATVIGLTHHIPTIGVARRLTKGKYEKIPSPDPDISHIAQEGKITGLEIRATGGKRSVFISPGFGISTEQTIAEYLQWSRKGKFPEPLRTAHIETRRAVSSSK
jgi:deoxyribonuclease V